MNFEDAWTKSRLSIEEYVQVCRDYPGFRRTIEIDDRVGYLEGLIEQAEIFGVNKKALQGILYPEFPWIVEEGDVDEVALGLLEALARKKEINPKFNGHAVRHGEAIPDSIVYRLAIVLLESCGTPSDIPPPLTLLALFEFLFCGNEQGRMASEAIRPEEKRLAAVILAADEGYSDRQISKAVGVDHTVIGRWKKDAAFHTQISRIGQIDGIKMMMEALNR